MVEPACLVHKRFIFFILGNVVEFFLFAIIREIVFSDELSVERVMIQMGSDVIPSQWLFGPKDLLGDKQIVGPTDKLIDFYHCPILSDVSFHDCVYDCFRFVYLLISLFPCGDKASDGILTSKTSLFSWSLLNRYFSHSLSRKQILLSPKSIKMIAKIVTKAVTRPLPR